VREARIRRGQVISAGSNAGFGAAKLWHWWCCWLHCSQIGENIGNINQQQTFAAETSAALQTSADQQVTAQNSGSDWCI